jgi:hypothetical protein
MLRSAQCTALRAALLLGLLGSRLLAPPVDSAQTLGTVQIQTVAAQLANATTCTGAAQNFITGTTTGFNNLGQTQHQVSASSAAASFTVEIDGIDVVGTVIRISNPTVSFQNGAAVGYVAQGTGYYPRIQVSVTCTASATFSMSYTGSSGGSTPIIAAPGTTPTVPNSSFTGNVQGVLATNVNASGVFPIVNGALQPAVNAKFVQFGLDNFSINTTLLPAASSGNFSFGNPPQPSVPGEAAIAFFSSLAAVGGTGLLAPWTCITAGCGPSALSHNAAIVNNVTTSTSLVFNETNSGGGVANTNENVVFLVFKTLPTVRQQTFANNITPATSGNTLAGSTLVASFQCNSFPCLIDSVSDTQGNVWRLVASVQISNGFQPGGLSVWMAGPSSAAAETATGVAHTGTAVNNSGILELTGLTPANLNQPNLPLFASNKTAQPNENDNGGMFIESGGFSYTQTLTISAAVTQTFPLWDQTQHGQFQSCTLSERVTNIAGAGTTLNTYLQDSADAIGFNDHISMPQATTVGGAQNYQGIVPVFTAAALTAVASGAVQTADAALAAGSVIAGPMGAFGRIKFVTTGAAVSVTVTYNVVCK